MNIRRKLLVALGVGVFAMHRAPFAQQPRNVWRLAFISPGSAAPSAAALSAFRDGMRENGLHEGEHYVLDVKYAEGDYDRFPALTAEVLKNNPAVILVTTIASVRAAQHATKTVPIVFVVNDPVGSGLVASLARPGGNTTGLSTQNEDSVSKFVELLRELLPRAKKVAVLVKADNPTSRSMFERVRASAGGFGVAAKAFEVTAPESLDASLQSIKKYRPDALLIPSDAAINDQRDRISAFGLRNRIPIIASSLLYVASGSLISYGTINVELLRRAATYVKKILAGAKPADLPVEQPTKIELVVNMKTAKALGIKIPQSILLRADKVVE
jgi:putative ABC transport system substrate-binding protein